MNLLYKERDAFTAIIDAIAGARSFICFQFYIFRNDETGTEIADVLRKKVREGISVYLLYDHFGSFGTPRSFWDGLKAEGIQIRASRPFKWLAPFHYARRDHRKLIIVDGEKAFTGGLNIANEYRGFHLRQKRGWRDTGIMLNGPIASDLLAQFTKSWNIWGREPAIFSPRWFPADKGALSDGLPVIPIFASSAKGRRRMRKILYHSIHSARAALYLTTAYFTPSRRMVDSLEDAVQRGVDVRLLLPGQSDIPAAYHAGRAFFARLLKAGVRIYAYQGEVLHAKSSVFDSYWSIVGSANLDFQSLRWNDEGNVGILDEGFGQQMTAVFHEDMNRSIEITQEEWAGRPLCEKAKERFFVLFRRRL
ncbi:MAG TPA: phospholipase D-like domain-containing protein [Thermodesulfovibrionales bacterium]|nr:phospholipase D-like domain-containing protein [Thermodesulfovibrionales bacterium]